MHTPETPAYCDHQGESSTSNAQIPTIQETPQLPQSLLSLIPEKTTLQALLELDISTLQSRTKASTRAALIYILDPNIPALKHEGKLFYRQINIQATEVTALAQYYQESALTLPLAAPFPTYSIPFIILATRTKIIRRFIKHLIDKLNDPQTPNNQSPQQNNPRD